jgi:hypothetical protein
MVLSFASINETEAIYVSIHPQVLSKLFAPDVRVNNQTIGSQALVVVELSQYQIVVSVIINGEVDLARVLPIGISNLERTVADRMQRPLKKQDCSFAAALISSATRRRRRKQPGVFISSIAGTKKGSAVPENQEFEGERARLSVRRGFGFQGS